MFSVLEGFRTPLKRASRDLVRFARKNDVGTVLVFDTGGRPSGILFKHAWEAMHPTIKPPKIFFIDPRGPLSKKVKAHIESQRGKRVLLLDDFFWYGKTFRAAIPNLERQGVKNAFTASMFSYPLQHANKVVFTPDHTGVAFSAPPWQNDADALAIKTTPSGVVRRYVPNPSRKDAPAFRLRKELKEIASEIPREEE